MVAPKLQQTNGTMIALALPSDRGVLLNHPPNSSASFEPKQNINNNKYIHIAQLYWATSEISYIILAFEELQYVAYMCVYIYDQIQEESLMRR